VQTCGAGGDWGACVGQVGPIAEQCNGIDDDCNGIVDDGFGALGEGCVVGLGDCARNGFRVCLNPGASACSAVSGAPSPEVCDGRDNDCDGTIDDGVCLPACLGAGAPAQVVALAQCRIDGFTCEARAGSVVGWANGGRAGSDCSPGNQWRFYCFVNGASGATCGSGPGGSAPCRLGEIHSGHTVQCSCNHDPPLIGSWCAPSP
jgi:hypothetical protein